MSAQGRKAKSIACTFCFLDIAGFSISSSKMQPRHAFVILESFFSMIEKIVVGRGGIIDKIMGDGMLFYFESDGGSEEDDHAYKAVCSAIEIQKQTLKFNMSVFEKHQITFPLRIGVNTALVYSGNILLSRVPTKVVLGEGLNFSKRLEESCIENHIMVSHVTLNLIKGRELAAEAFPINIKVKHSKSLTKAHCLNPFTPEEKSDQVELEKCLRKSNAVYRKETRVNLLTKPIPIYGNGFSGTIVDFSRNGLKIMLSSCYGVGVDIEIYFGRLDSDLSKLMFDLNLQPLIYQVRWLEPVAERSFCHGLRLNLISTIQKNILFSMFEEYEKGELSINRSHRLIG